MAYENYTPVSWSDGTPITGARLQQMTTNIEQVKDATDDKPKGLLRLKTITANTSSFSDFTEHEIVALEDETSNPLPNSGDNRVTVDAYRWYKITINFPGVAVTEPGNEDSVFNLKICSGQFGGANTTIKTYKFTVPPYTYLNSASNATPVISDHSVKGNFPTRVGAGTYTVIANTSTALSNQDFFVSIIRNQGQSNNSPSAYVIPCADTSCDLFVEDVGGTV